MTNPTQPPPGVPPTPGFTPYPGPATRYVPPNTPLWPLSVPQPPSASGPLTVGAIGGALAGGAAGFILCWVLLSVGLEQNGDDFSDVDGGKFMSIAMLFAVIGAFAGAATGLIIGAIVWSNRKSRFQAQFGAPQPWQQPGSPSISQQYVQATQQYTQAPQPEQREP